jgi:hypothetical protein
MPLAIREASNRLPPAEIKVREPIFGVADWKPAFSRLKVEDVSAILHGTMRLVQERDRWARKHLANG